MMLHETKSNEPSVSQDGPNTVSNKDVVLFAPMETKAAFSRAVYPRQHGPEKREWGMGFITELVFVPSLYTAFYGGENQIKEGEL